MDTKQILKENKELKDKNFSDKLENISLENQIRIIEDENKRLKKKYEDLENLYNLRKHYEESERYFDEANSYSQRGKYKKAISYYRKYIKYAIKHSLKINSCDTALHNIANCYASNQESYQAILYYKKIISKYDDYSFAIAKCYQFVGRYENSLEYYMKNYYYVEEKLSKEFNKESNKDVYIGRLGGAFYSLFSICVILKKYKRSVYYLKKLIYTEPKEREFRYNLFKHTFKKNGELYKYGKIEDKYIKIIDNIFQNYLN